LSREAQILIDADNLGALGFSGIKRTIQYARNLNEILYDPQNTKTRSTIKHIEDYVLNLYKFLFTPKAKEIGKPLDKEARLFINEFYQEYYSTKNTNYDMQVFQKYNLL
jgi:HD superfamily phosphodiesterase